MRDSKVRGIIGSVLVAAMLLVPALPLAVLGADPTAEAGRTIAPPTVGPGGKVEVAVEFESLLDDPQGFALVEGIPTGWGFASIDDGDADYLKVGESTIEWLWLTVAAGATRTVVYTLTVPDDAAATDYPVEGVVKAARVDNSVLGENTVTVEGEPLELYSVTLVADPPGAAELFAGAGAYQPGQNVTIQMVEAAADFDFVEWTSVPVVVFDDPAAEETAFTMPAQDVTVTARFEPETVPPVDDDDDPVNTLAIVVALVVLAAVIAGAAILVRRRRARS